jgi:hypothetical protein
MIILHNRYNFSGYTANPDPVTNLNSFVVDWPLGFSQVFTFRNFILSRIIKLINFLIIYVRY